MLDAQDDETLIQNLTGEIDRDWLLTAGDSIPVKQFEWTVRKVPGYMKTSPAARQQALLSQPWVFYKNDVDKGITKVGEAQFPHSFERNRSYNSGWYLTKYKIDKIPDKRYILKLNRLELFSMIYVNGTRCGHHIGAYTPFEVDITDGLIQGDNTLAIYVYDKSAALDGDRLITQVSTSRLSAGKQGFGLPGGIDDAPLLELRENSYIRDVFVKTSTRKGEMEIEYELSSITDLSSGYELSFELLKWPEGEKADLEIPAIASPKLTPGVQSLKINWDNPDLWSPDHPNLYVLRTTLQKENKRDVLETRFGFREFWVKGKSFMLNGTPIRLRGESNYHPQRSGVDFNREVFNMHKKVFGSNACRIHAFMPHGDIILGADEAGMLLIDQSGVWSVNGQMYARGGDLLLHNLGQEFEEWVRRDRNSPSVVIWDVENEMLRFNYEMHLPWVSKLPGLIEKFDTTRPFNFSGAGWFSPDQDMVSLHMQDHYARIMSDWVNRGTTPLIMGEFWIGARASQRLPNAPEISSVHQRYLEEAEAYERNMLEMRYFGVSGIMPFRISILGLKQVPHTTIGYNFTPPNTLVKEKQPEDVLNKIRHALQPVTVFFWPRETYAPADKNFQRELVICNDGETKESFEVEWKWEKQAGKSETLLLDPAGQQRIIITEKLPAAATRIIAVIKCRNKIISSDTLLIDPIVIPEDNSIKTLQVYNDRNLSNILTEAGFKSFSNTVVPELKDNVLWLIPEHASNRELNAIKDEILKYLEDGGNILCLKQDQAPTWFPVKLQFWSASLTHLHTYEAMGWQGLNKDLRYAKYATILASSHPVFSGIRSPALHLWDDFDGRVCDDAFSRPSSVGKFEQGNWRPLAAAALNTHVSLAEIFYGKGTMLACQLNVIDNIENVQALRLFGNMLSYLSNIKPGILDNHITVKGGLSAIDISKLTGAKEQSLSGTNVLDSEVMLAFEGADIGEIKEWAAQGGTVVVLSDKVSGEFEGITISQEDGASYVVSKAGDHPMIFGVSSANFQSPIADAYFETIPENSRVLLQGFSGESDFWRINEAGPVMISIPYKKGEIILSTIKIDLEANVHAREFLCLILTNCGVQVPYVKPSADEIVVKKTVPITVDGKLDEWLEDMEDRFVSPYVHAQPVYLKSENIVEGPPAYDLSLSAINYFLWNEKAFHIAGVVFAEEKNALSSINYGAQKEYHQQIHYNGDVIDISFISNKIEILINGKSNNSIQIERGQLNSRNMTDATKLQFSYISGGGSITTVSSLVGETYEVLIPWDQLKSKASDKNSRAMISLESKGWKILEPLSASPKSKETWLDMILGGN